MLKYLRSLMLFIFIIGYSCLISGQDRWYSYAPKNTYSSFMISSPGQFDQTIDSIETEVGEIISEQFYYILDERPKFTFMVNMIQYPSELLPVDSTEIQEELLNQIIYDSADQLFGTVIYDTDTSTDHILSRMYRISYGADTMSIKARVMLHEKQLYNVQVACPSSSNLDKKVDRFLDSFKIIEQEK